MKKSLPPLPPPHWSPTGNGGEWRWGEEKIGEQERGCWHWRDDVYGEMSPLDIIKLRRQETKGQIRPQKWWQKLFK